MPKQKEWRGGRLVIANILASDQEAIDLIQELHGHNAKSGAVRYALRQFSEAQKTQKLERMCIKVRREGCQGTKEHINFMMSAIRVPVKLGVEDNASLELLKTRWELDSFAQVVRLALRYVQATEGAKAKA